MRMRYLAAVTALLLLTPITAAQEDVFEGDLKALNVDDQAPVNITVINELPIDDQIRISFGGTALNGLVNVVDYPSECATDPSVSPCIINVTAESQKDLALTVEAISPGQGTLEGNVTSTVTDLSNSDDIAIRVEPRYGGEIFTAPGVTATQLMALLLAAAAFLVFGPRWMRE